MTGKLENKTALVTGSSRGIGRSIACQLAAEGALVAVHCASRRDAAEAACGEIEAAGGRAFVLQADLRELAQIRRLFQELDAELSARTGSNGLDILISNAGDDSVTGFEETSETLFDHLFDLNVKAPFFLYQEALGRLRDNGRVVSISSLVGRGSHPARPVYAASKAAVNSVTLSLAGKLGPRGVTVNTVAPGATTTELSADTLNDPLKAEAIKAATALRRFGSPQDVASVVSFLVSEEGGWITGQLIEATGGMRL